MKLYLALLLSTRLIEVPLGLDRYLPVPDSNPLTIEKVALGRRLFFEKNLSRDSTIACATCHEPSRSYTDVWPKSIGVNSRRGEFRSPRIINRVYGKSFFWDGRAKSLEEQVIQPISNPLEMDLPIAEAVARLAVSADYPSITLEMMRDALASYVRTILSGNSPYDRHVAGDKQALSDSAKLGLKIFRGKGGCLACHLGPNLTDERLHNTGIGRGTFKTPTLREVARQGPYMHDGSLSTLEDVIDYYDKGGNAGIAIDSDMHPLHLTQQEKLGLLDFLKALTGVIQEGL